MRHFLSITFCAIFSTLSFATHEEHVHDRSQGSSFVENLGQWPAPVLFRTGASGASLFIEQDGWSWSMFEGRAIEMMHDVMEFPEDVRDTLTFRGHAWRMRFVDPVQGSRTVGLDRSAAYHNYFLGNDPDQWRSHVGLYGRVRKDEVWPGVDVLLKSEQGNFKYDIILSPGADAGRIGMRYEGLDALTLSDQGFLVMRTSVGELIEQEPVAFYGDEKGGSVKCAFTLSGSIVGFQFPEGVDQQRPIVIDPVLLASTLSGTGDIGTTSNYGHAATFDDQGNIYTGARCFGQGYPATAGAFQTVFGEGSADVVISKLNGDGSSLIYATYLGGSGTDLPHSLFVNADQEMYVMSSSNSANYPVSSNAFDPTFNGVGAFADEDLVITHLDQAGSSIIGSTYVGGAAQDGLNGVYSNYGDGYRGEIIVDAAGNCIVATSSYSADFPTTTGAAQSTHGGGQDAVLLSMDPTLSTLLFSTFLGGSGDDAGYGVVSDGSGGFFVCGSTEGDGFPTTAGAFQTSFIGDRDAFLAHVTGNATVIANSTFFGTSDMDQAFFVDTDLNGDVFIFGESEGVIPIAPAGTFGAVGDGFVAKFPPDLSTALLTTEIGSGSGNMAPIAFLVDLCDNIYLSSHAGLGGMPSGMPVTSDQFQTSGGFYLGVFEPNMSGQIFGTYYGGGSDHVDGGTSRFDKNGIVYQGVCTSNGFNTTPNAFSGTYPGGYDIGVFKIDFESAGVQANIASDAQNGCVPATFNLVATGQAQEFSWDLGDGSPLLSGTEVSVTYNEIGTYVVTLIGSDPNACNIADTTFYTLNVYDPNELRAAFEVTPVSSCDGYFLEVTNTSVGATQYQWDFGDGVNAVGFSPTHEYDDPGTYVVGLTILNDICVDTADTAVPVTFEEPVLSFEPASPVAICNGVSVQLSVGNGFDSYAWSTGESSPMITVQEIGDYAITVTDGFCEASGTIQVIAAPNPPPSPDAYKCANQSVVLGTGFPVNSIQWDIGGSTPTITVTEEGVYGFAAIDQYGCDVIGEVLVIQLPSERPNNLIPNVFTPNGDLKNDRFEVVADGLEDFRMEVYDRWGMKMYETNNQFTGWNGGLDNSASTVPDGTYYYVIDFRDLCSNEPFTTRTGHVTLLR